MTRTSKSTLRLTALAAALALGTGLFAVPAALAGDRWDRDRNHRVERHYDRERDYRRDHKWDRKAYKRHEKAHKRDYRFKKRDIRPKRHHHHYVERREDYVAPVIVGIGLGILTYAILNDSHGHSRGY